MRGVPKLQKKLKSSINAINFENLEYDNPIYRAQSDFKFKETVTKSKDTYIIEQLDDLKKRTTTINVISNFVCTIFGNVECTEIGNMACT